MARKPQLVDPWTLTCALLRRTIRHFGADEVALSPLGELGPEGGDEVLLREWWPKVWIEAERRGGELHLGEVVGDVLQAEDHDARKVLAFCQTPGFVAEYLLDHVVDPAFAEYGWANQGSDERDDEGRAGDCDQRIRLLDPSCGSGHLLVRGARRIVVTLNRGQSPCELPGVSAWGHDRGVDVVTGYEINPKAAAVARVRLALEVLRQPRPDERHAGREWDAALERALDDGSGGAVQVRDSLLDPGDERFEMVVANPPYVTPKDAAQREAIRQVYESAHGKYGLHGPFMEAITRKWLMPGGFACTIVGNNFMKREWGKSLIEHVLASTDLRMVVDTSGAYIPGHGTPTCILGLRGEGHKREDRKVAKVTGKKGEPSTPEDPAQGKVWSAILETRAQTVTAMRAN